MNILSDLTFQVFGYRFSGFIVKIHIFLFLPPRRNSVVYEWIKIVENVNVFVRAAVTFQLPLQYFLNRCPRKMSASYFLFHTSSTKSYQAFIILLRFQRFFNTTYKKQPLIKNLQGKRGLELRRRRRTLFRDLALWLSSFKFSKHRCRCRP